METRRTRLRQPVWNRADTIVTIVAAVSAAITITWIATDPEGASYRVYPELTIPVASPVVLAGLALLLVPALLTGRESNRS